MNSIIVIGTEPSCPRCQLLKNIIGGKIKEFNLNVNYSKIDYASKEAFILAKSHGLRPGTAKTVAEVLNIPVDSHAFTTLYQNYQPNPKSPYFSYNDCMWSYEMDQLLQPLEARALEAGIMMTPVLVINGKIVHQGSVPEIEKINQWLIALQE